jgi:hypothetical protein
MPSILDALDWHELQPTASYPRREYQWVPGKARHDDRDGTLTIRLAKGKRAGSVWDQDRYGVQAEDAGPGWRMFLLRNDGDDEQPDVYRVTIGDRGDACTCDAGRAKKRCKHLDSVADLLAEQLYPDQQGA